MSQPLFIKLGIKEGMHADLEHTPADYLHWLTCPPEIFDKIKLHAESKPLDFIHVFAQSEEDLLRMLDSKISKMAKTGKLWISWPKKSSSISSDIDKWDVMRIGQACGLVDVKVASINDDWSGHMFVYRLKDR